MTKTMDLGTIADISKFYEAYNACLQNRNNHTIKELKTAFSLVSASLTGEYCRKNIGEENYLATREKFKAMLDEVIDQTF